METSNSTPQETVPVPAAVPAPEATAAPAEATPAPAAAPVPVGAPAPVAAAKAEPFTGEIPKTDGKTKGGWNRFAGYNPNEAKNKKNDRGQSKGRR